MLIGSVAAEQLLAYRVVRDGQPDCYLVGTMHSEDPRVMALIEPLTPLIERVDVVAIELIPDAVALLAVGAASVLPVDQSLRELVGEVRFAALSDAARERGLPTELIDRLQPWAAAVSLSVPRAQSGRFLDSEIYLRALERGKQTLGLESVGEQLGVFADMPFELQLTLLDDAIKNAGRVPKQLEVLTRSYLQADLDAMERVTQEQYEQMSPQVTRWFKEILLENRNRRMLDRLKQPLRKQATLVAVGALHLGGRHGLVSGLRDLGYKVEPWRE